MQTWGDAHEQAELVEMLREAHGPLLFLLDYHALACFRMADYAQSLDIIERRQRRSTTIASQALEARALLAMGHTAHAQAVADDISQAYPWHVAAICAAADIYTRLGSFDQARVILEQYLDYRQGDLEATLTLARLAQQAGFRQLADEYVQRLGTGIPSDIGDEQLQELGALLATLGNEQSAQAVWLELERRRQLRLQAIQKAISPIVDQGELLIEDPQQFYRHLSGPESIAMSKQERRRIQLEAVRHFGFMDLREGQAETIAAILRRESILTVMPTGAGKSLCYQLPALMLPKATLVISPLIALMKDQVESLPPAARKLATFVNSTLTDAEMEARLVGVAAGQYKLIYAAPERLRQLPFLRALRNAGLDLFVVDEAHCVSLWGHDFRPDYLFIQDARQELGNPPALAMTATAPPRVRDEIVDYISDDGTGVGEEVDTGRMIAHGMHRPQVMTLDIFRSNLHLSALRFNNEEEKLAALLKFVTETDGSGIVYVNSRHKSESLAFGLRAAGVGAEAYHAGIEGRGSVQDRFMSDQTRVVVATIAFGMGIDKHDIRFIVHFHPSRSLAAYYQEVGRAGRDGKLSQGILFYSNNDWANLRRWAKADESTVEFLEKVYTAVATQLGIHAGEEAPADMPLPGQTVIGPVDPRRLQQVLNVDETTVRVATSMLERVDLLACGFDIPLEISIALERKLGGAAKQDEDFQYLLKGLALRPGQEASFKTKDIAEFMRWPLHETEPNLLDWDAAGYVKLKSNRRMMLVELSPRVPDMRQRLERLLDQTAAIAQRRIDDVIGYATAESCRHGYISAHFGSPPRTHCVVCDNCTGIRPDVPKATTPTQALPDDADIEPMVIDCLISLPKPVGRSGLARILAGSLRAPVTPDKARHHSRLKAMGEATIMNYIDDLLEDNRLRQYERQGYPVLAPTMRGRVEAEAWLEGHPDLAILGAAPVAIEDESEDLPAEGDKYTALQKAIWLWRRRCAQEQGQPPYMIMSNELILRIAETRPQSEAELAGLPGMGAQRLEHYGPTILDLVQLYPAQEGDNDLMSNQRELQEHDSEHHVRVQRQEAAVSRQVERLIFLKLQEMRQKHAIRLRSKPYLVASNTLLKAISQAAPVTQHELEQIAGFRGSGLHDLSGEILAFIVDARKQEVLTS